MRPYAALLLGLVGCTLLTNLDGLDDVAQSPTPPDATPNTDAERNTDAGGLPSDAGADACPGFCDGFDDGALGARWSRVAVSGGSIEVDAKDYRSASRSFRSRANAGQGTRYAVLGLNVERLPSSVRCSFAVWLREDVSPTASQWLDVFRIVGEAPGVSSYSLVFGTRQRRQSGVRIDIAYADGGVEYPRTVSTPTVMQPLRADTWMVVEVETDFRAVSVRFDGVEVISGPFDFGLSPTTAGISLGVHTTAPKEADALFDDLQCTFGG